jgi:hypothetical protein
MKTLSSLEHKYVDIRALTPITGADDSVSHKVRKNISPTADAGDSVSRKLRRTTSPTAGTGTSVSRKLRAINVEVPEEVYWHVRNCAIQSRLAMKDFMARFCQDARPYSPAHNWKKA